MVAFLPEGLLFVRTEVWEGWSSSMERGMFVGILHDGHPWSYRTLGSRLLCGYAPSGFGMTKSDSARWLEIMNLKVSRLYLPIFFRSLARLTGICPRRIVLIFRTLLRAILGVIFLLPREVDEAGVEEKRAWVFYLRNDTVLGLGYH